MQNISHFRWIMLAAVVLLAPISSIRAKEVAEATEDAVATEEVLDEEPDYEALEREFKEVIKAREDLAREVEARGAVTEKDRESNERLLGRLIGLMISADHGTFRLEGEVVGEEGAFLDGVRLVVTRERTTGIDRSESRMNEYMIDQSFSIKASGYTAVGLTFNKPGYYQARLRYQSSRAEDDEELGKEFDAGRIRPKRIEKSNLRVVMHRIGKVASVRPENYQPRFYLKDTQSRLRLRSFNDISLDRSFPRVQEIQWGTDEIPELAVYLTTTLDDSGKIRHLEGEIHPFPHEVTLALNATEGGFILHEGGAPEAGFWFMDEPPEGGYQQELKLDGRMLYDRIVKTPHPLQGLYFYFKIGDTYGKAKLNSLRIIDNGNTLHSNIEMLFQPDGTRFLRTGRNYQ